MAEVKDEPTPRSAEQTAQRVLALLTVAGKVHDPEGCTRWMTKHKLQRFLSPSEIAFVQAKRLSAKSRAAFSWRGEAMVSLLWALKGLSQMPPLNQQVRVFEIPMVKTALQDPHAFISQARLRSAKAISDMESHLCHQHWRVRDAQLFGIGKFLEPSRDEPPIDELNHDIVYERRYALSWLVGWGKDWDSVPTDT